MAPREGTPASRDAAHRSPSTLVLKIVTAAASVLAFVVLAGSGSLLAAVEQSGAQGFGSLLAFVAILGFAAATLLVVAPERTFGAPGGRIGAGVAGVLALLPIGALAVALLRFARPFSGAPALDVPLSMLGLLFVAGAFSTVGLAVARMRNDRVTPEPLQKSARETFVRSQVLDMSLLKLRGAYDAATSRETTTRERLGGESVEADDGIRVTRV